MPRRCAVTGAKPSFGNAVSRSRRYTRRRCTPNVQNRRYRLPSERRWMRLTLTAKGWWPGTPRRGGWGHRYHRPDGASRTTVRVRGVKGEV